LLSPVFGLQIGGLRLPDLLELGGLKAGRLGHQLLSLLLEHPSGLLADLGLLVLRGLRGRRRGSRSRAGLSRLLHLRKGPLLRGLLHLLHRLLRLLRPTLLLVVALHPAGLLVRPAKEGAIVCH